MTLTAKFGLTATLLGAGATTHVGAVAQMVESTYNRRYNKSAKHVLKFGAAGFNAEPVDRTCWLLGFARDLEERTDGEILVELLVTTRFVASCLVLKKRKPVSLIFTRPQRKTQRAAHHI